MTEINQMELALQNMQRQIEELLAAQNARNAAPDAAANPEPNVAANADPEPRDRRNLKPDKPPTFAGDRNESIDTWIFQIERYFELMGIRETDQANLAASYLKKSAATWWMVEYRREETAGRDLNWDTLVQRLRSRFKPINAGNAARDKLGRLKQTGSVSAYSHAFRIIMQDVPDMHELDQLHYYSKGLREEVAIQVGLQNPISIQDAETMAERVDAILYAHRNARLQASASAYPAKKSFRTPGGVIPMELDTIGRKALTDKDRDRLRKEGKCFYCREGKHLARDCPERKSRRGVNSVEEEDNDRESGKDDSPAE